MSDAMINWTPTARKAGKTKSALEAYEEAKARGEHAHHYSSSGVKCSVNCGASHCGPAVSSVPTVPFR